MGIAIKGLWLCGPILLGLLGSEASAAECTKDGAETYIRESEDAWASSVATNDASVTQRILAGDFIWVYPDGTTKTKADAVAGAAGGPWGFQSNHTDHVDVRFFGDTFAVAQGSETWVRKKKDGSLVNGRFVWTDTWVCRDGAWQIVAAEDLIAPVPAAK